MEQNGYKISKFKIYDYCFFFTKNKFSYLVALNYYVITCFIFLSNFLF